MFHAQSDVALVVNASRIREFVRLEVHSRLRFVLIICELSHDLTIDWAPRKSKRFLLIFCFRKTFVIRFWNGLWRQFCYYSVIRFSGSLIFVNQFLHFTGLY